MFNVGLWTKLPPTACEYQSIDCPPPTVAVAVKVWIFGESTHSVWFPPLIGISTSFGCVIVTLSSEVQPFSSVTITW